MRHNVPLCAGQSGQKMRNGCQTKFENYFLAAFARVYRQAIWSSAVLISQPGKSKAVRRRWTVADDICGNLELLRMLIDAGIRPLTNACASSLSGQRELSSSIAPRTLVEFRPTSRSMPETQHNPVAFNRVHVNNRTFDECSDVGFF
jgi:hypothetical protein